MNTETAKTFHEGFVAKDRIESEIFDLLNFEFEIYGDYYDNSLEICLGEDVPPDWSVNQELADLVYSFGFSRFWVNWLDRTEQYCSPEGGITPRKSKPLPVVVTQTP